jgi:GNAT superfamily N-acetyltransferase
MLTSQLTFRPLAAAPTLKALLSFQRDAGWSVSKKAVADNLTKTNRVQWVSVELDKVRIGMAKLELAPPEFCYITDLVIKSKFRGQGVGRWFLHNIEDMCHALGIKRMILVPEPASLPFYQRLSFVPDPLVPHCLKKEISPLRRKVFLARS